MPVLAEEPPVLVDWLPWNHTFGGNHNVGLTIYNGGTLYIDDGKPTPALMHETLRNLREIAPTVYFNVPTGFEAIANAMKTDDALRRNLLSRVRMFFYAGAALAQPVWDTLHEVQEREIGERIVMGTGLGMTESSPFAIFVTNPNVRAGYLGVPTPGLELKLIPVDGKIEVRYKGPNITPGYWRSPEATKEGFDEEGFFCTGDAVQWIAENDVHQGLKFDGRIAEDFKLATGTFVSVGPMRARIIAAGAPYVQDAVITGLNLHEVGALIFPTPAVRQLTGMAADTPLKDVLESAPVQAHFQQVADARLDLDCVEGLADEVLGADLQGAQLVAGLRGDHEHRQVGVGRVGLEAFHHLEAVHHRHLQVEQDEVVAVPAVQRADLGRVHGGGHAAVARAAQHLQQQGDVGFLVVDHQQAGIEKVGLGDDHAASLLGGVRPAAALPENCSAASRAAMNAATLMGLVR
jgi:hypothetical protein